MEWSDSHVFSLKMISPGNTFAKAILIFLFIMQMNPVNSDAAQVEHLLIKHYFLLLTIAGAGVLGRNLHF